MNEECTRGGFSEEVRVQILQEAQKIREDKLYEKLVDRLKLYAENKDEFRNWCQIEAERLSGGGICLCLSDSLCLFEG